VGTSETPRTLQHYTTYGFKGTPLKLPLCNLWVEGGTSETPITEQHYAIDGFKEGPQMVPPYACLSESCCIFFSNLRLLRKFRNKLISSQKNNYSSVIF